MGEIFKWGSSKISFIFIIKRWNILERVSSQLFKMFLNSLVNKGTIFNASPTIP